MIAATNNLDKLKEVGLILEPSGINSFFIREIPTWIKLDNSDIMIEKIIYYLLAAKTIDVIGGIVNSPPSTVTPALEANTKGISHPSGIFTFTVLDEETLCATNAFSTSHSIT